MDFDNRRQAPRGRRNLLTILLVALMATTTTMATMPASVAHAQDMDKFRQLIAEATKLAFEGDYDGAITKYFEAKTIQDDPLLDYNIARCYHKMGNCTQAKRFYDNVISSGGADDETAAESKKYIAELGECPADDPDPVVKNDPVDNTGEPKETGDPKDTEPDPLDPNPSDEGMSTLALAGWGTLIGGGVFVLSGLGLDLASAGLADNLQAAADSGDQAEYDSIQEDIDSRTTTIWVLYGIGALGVATGATLVILDMTSEDSATASSTTIAPMFTPDGAGASVRVTF